MMSRLTPMLRLVAGAIFLTVIAWLGLGALFGPAARAVSPAAAPSGAAPGAAVASGRPARGPVADLSVVNLRALPQVPAVHSQALPFRSMRGPSPPNPNLVPRLKLPIPGRVPAGLVAMFAGPGAPPLLPDVSQGFDGINSEESGGTGGPCGCVPPDGDVSVGPSHVIVAVNSAFAVYSKAGARLAGPVGFDTFFAGCGPTGMTSSDGVTAYDPVAHRFTVGILRYVTSNGPSYVSLGVSQTGDPTGNWNLYCFLQDYQGAAALYDFPHISVGQQALYSTGNLFAGQGGTFASARVNAYDKTAMYSGAVTATQVFTDVTANADGSSAYTIRPALFNIGLPSATNYFINSQNSGNVTNTLVTVWRWTDPFGANSFAQSGGVDVTPYAEPIPMEQLGGQPVPGAVYIDSRTLGAMWANNTLYATHAIGCNPGAGTTDCIQWYQVGQLNGPVTLKQQGIVGANAQYRTYPNISVDKYENVELSYAYSSPTDYIGLRHSGRYQNNDPGLMCCETEIKAGEQAELGFNGLRWGDYSGSVVDPNGLDLWHFEEYSKAVTDPAGSWGTWTSNSTFTCQRVNWTAGVGVAGHQNDLTKINPAAGWNAGAVSNLALASGDGFVSTLVNTTTIAVMSGLSHGDSNQSYTDIDFAIYQDPVQHMLRIFEDGVGVHAAGPYAVGDRLNVNVQSGVVKYFRNNTLLYTSTHTPTYPLLLDTSIYTPHAAITSAYLCGRTLVRAP